MNALIGFDHQTNATTAPLKQIDVGEAFSALMWNTWRA